LNSCHGFTGRQIAVCGALRRGPARASREAPRRRLARARHASASSTTGRDALRLASGARDREWRLGSLTQFNNRFSGAGIVNADAATRAVAKKGRH